MIKRLFLLLVAASASLAVGCSGGDPPPGDGGPTGGSECQLKATSEKFPGYPFVVNDFKASVLPTVQASCATGTACHAAPTGQAGFTVWAATDPQACDFAKSFNSINALIDVNVPANSKLTSKVTGVQPTGHFTFQETDPKLKILRDYIGAAAAQVQADNPTTPPITPASPFDIAVFNSTIKVMFDRCAQSGCHLAPSGQRGFNLKNAPTLQADIDANFAAITGRTTPSAPATSQVYVQATTLHASGLSKTVNGTEAAALLAWITEAGKVGGPVGTSTCAPINKFNVGTFNNEIFPILNGEIDLNNGNVPPAGSACTNALCHGQQRGPGTLFMPKDDPTTALKTFVCFVDLASPSRSEVLACPTDTAGCHIKPHPGADILGDGADKNYQKILGFLLGANAAVSPFDFAFYVRNIEPLFNDINSVEGGARNITCAETTACHGSPSGQAPPNGSDFPIIPQAVGKEVLTLNFSAATQFTNFVDATESSLFLYPTNEVANTVDHKFATGRDHPGGLDFAKDSAQALLILQWASGLRPDGQGFNHNWLVAGNFNDNDINRGHLGGSSDGDLAPSIFDLHAGTFSDPLGGWDGFFPAGADIDFNVPFPLAVAQDRIAYAVTYVTNTQGTDLRAKILVTSDNALQIFVDGNITEKGPGGQAIANVTFPATGTQAKSVKVTIKLLQLVTEPTAKFTAQFVDQNNNPLTNLTGELIFTLGPQGGI